MPKTIPLKVQKRSGADLSFQNIVTSKPGTITPLVCRELLPDTHVNLSTVMAASMPPLAFDSFMRVSLKVQAFFVPTRLLVGSAVDFFTKSKLRSIEGVEYTPLLPYFEFDCGYNDPWDKLGDKVLGSGTLSDYLGLVSTGYSSGQGGSNLLRISCLPYLAYHKVTDDWFRSTRIQKPFFSHQVSNTPVLSKQIGSLPFDYPNLEEDNYLYLVDSQCNPDYYPEVFCFADGHSIFDLRQCNFEDDYFTIAMQEASEEDVHVAIEAGEFGIGALRLANALQRYADRRAIVGPRFQDWLKSEYNANLSNGVAQRTLLLGSGEFEVFSKGIYANAAPTSGTNNPFDSVGARYGDAYASGELNLVDDFTTDEPGYLMVMAELVPRVTYASGIDRKLTRYIGAGSQIDLPNPLFQGIGNQPIYARELDAKWATVELPDAPRIFGYTERFADWKTAKDECHGLVRDGESLQAMVLQRSFDGDLQDTSTMPVISNNFLQIPTNYLDQVTAATADVSQYGYWLDAFFRFRVSQHLSPYSIPCLEDVDQEHQDTVNVRAGGSRLP